MALFFAARFSLQPSSTVANRPTRRLTGSERIVANPEVSEVITSIRGPAANEVPEKRGFE